MRVLLPEVEAALMINACKRTHVLRAKLVTKVASARVGFQRLLNAILVGERLGSPAMRLDERNAVTVALLQELDRAFSRLQPRYADCSARYAQPNSASYACVYAAAVT